MVVLWNMDTAQPSGQSENSISPPPPRCAEIWESEYVYFYIPWYLQYMQTPLAPAAFWASGILCPGNTHNEHYLIVWRRGIVWINDFWSRVRMLLVFLLEVFISQSWSLVFLFSACSCCLGYHSEKSQLPVFLNQLLRLYSTENVCSIMLNICIMFYVQCFVQNKRFRLKIIQI